MSNNNISRFYAIVSLNHVVVTDDYDELREDLMFWPDERCEAFGAETIEEANVLAIQTYAVRFFGHPGHFGLVPMALPANGCYSLAAPLGSDFPSTLSHLRNIPEAKGTPVKEISAFEQGSPLQLAPIRPNTVGVLSHGGAWSIVGMNACALTENAEEVAGLLAEEEMIYPHAVCWGDISVAIRWLQFEYAKRISTRYDYRNYYPPQMNRDLLVGEQFADSQYEERERGYSDTPVMQRLRGFGLI